MSSKIFENSFFNDGILEFWSEALIDLFIEIFIFNWLSFEDSVEIETMGAFDSNPNMLFLRNEFPKIFEDLLTMT